MEVLLVQVFSGQNSTPVIGVLDKTLCTVTGTPVSTTNEVPYTISGGFNSDDRAAIAKAMRALENNTCLTYVGVK